MRKLCWVYWTTPVHSQRRISFSLSIILAVSMFALLPEKRRWLGWRVPGAATQGSIDKIAQSVPAGLFLSQKGPPRRIGVVPRPLRAVGCKRPFLSGRARRETPAHRQRLRLLGRQP